ncbi:hypothetical protein QOZ99_004321 [Angulomicrobium amanitiforme]|uniref:AraC-type transcription regulator ligand-binding domain-containing protein n=2 Tax=Ancylobacter amanitiformis TaxID=217069 RepID=A0ABU0LXH7_9HYPH|nr:hypothetical protein [Ancylobacter amanitiformis]
MDVPIRHGEQEGDAEFEALGGTFRLDAVNAPLLLALLPRMIHIPHSAGRSARLGRVIDLITEECGGDEPGKDMILQRMLEVLLVEALRWYGVTPDDGRAGLLNGMRDPALARVLRAMRARRSRNDVTRQQSRSAARRGRAGRGVSRVPAPPAMSQSEVLILMCIAYFQPITCGELGHLRSLGFIAAGQRSPQPGAPYTYVTTKEFLPHFGFDTLRYLPDMEALEEAGLLNKQKLLAGEIPIGGREHYGSEEGGEDEGGLLTKSTSFSSR